MTRHVQHINKTGNNVYQQLIRHSGGMTYIPELIFVFRKKA